jgi:hypothetical protein
MSVIGAGVGLLAAVSAAFLLKKFRLHNCSFGRGGAEQHCMG